MSSTRKTTNYDLSQFDANDVPGWLTDYNGDMSKIDTAIKTVADAESGSASDIAALGNRVTAAEGDISDLQTEDTGIKARVNTLENNYDTIHHEVVLLDQKVDGVEATANAASTAAGQASTTAQAASQTANQASQVANAASAEVALAATSIQRVTMAVTQIENELDAAEGDIISLKNKTANLGSAANLDAVYTSIGNVLAFVPHVTP